MPSNNKIDMIYDTLTNFRTETQERMGRIEEDLKIHKEGVIQNRTRIEKLEKPWNALREIKKWAKWIITISGAAIIIAKIMEWL